MNGGEAAHVRAGLGVVLQEGEVCGLFLQPVGVVEAGGCVVVGGGSVVVVVVVTGASSSAIEALMAWSVTGS